MQNFLCVLGAVKLKRYGCVSSVEHVVWSTDCTAHSTEENKFKLMQDTKQGQGSVGECVWSSAAKTAHLYIELEFKG